MTVLVEGFAPDAVALAGLLVTEGRAVRLAGRGAAPSAAAALRRDGVAVEEHVDLDADPGPAELAYLDVWTPEVAPRASRLRARGTRISCLSELLLERAPVRSLGVTGTAGKTTTATLAVQLLRGVGIDVAAGSTARGGNLWATEELVERLPSLRPPSVLVLELTSSHLCFMKSSPDVAVVTSFWADHIELHGSLAAYRAAKETIVRGQTADDWVVVNEDDAGASPFASLTPARRASFSQRRAVERGTFVERDRVVARWDGHELELARAPELSFVGAQRGNVLAAVTAALALGAPLEALPGLLPSLVPPPYRARTPAYTEQGLAIVDDGLAATPTKAAATLEVQPDGSVVLVAGGDPAPCGVRVHASTEEQALLERACDQASRAARVAVLFGPAGAELAERLGGRGVELRQAASFDDAVAQAFGAAVTGGLTLLFSPMYPVAQADRERFAALALTAAGRVRE